MNENTIGNVEKTGDNASCKHYCVIACHVLWRELCHFAAQAPHSFSFRFLEQGLHETPDALRNQLQKTIDEEDGKNYDALLIGYGLCSNGLKGIRARTTPLVCVRAHDCITFLLGSKERYQRYFDTSPGTYWYTPGWIEDTPMPGPERYADALQRYTAQYGEENARYLMETAEAWYSQYSAAAYVDLAIGNQEPYRKYTQRCAAWLQWRCNILKGDPRLITALLNGPWPKNDFLIVEPGTVINPSYDTDIITTTAPLEETPAAPTP